MNTDKFETTADKLQDQVAALMEKLDAAQLTDLAQLLRDLADDAETLRSPVAGQPTAREDNQ